MHCLSCRWAGWHPEAISEYTDGNNIVQIPQKYIGVELRLKQELDMHQKISDYKGSVCVESGKEKKVSFVVRVLNALGAEKIGDLRGKNVFDIAAVKGCGSVKLEAVIGLFFDVD